MWALWYWKSCSSSTEIVAISFALTEEFEDARVMLWLQAWVGSLMCRETFWSMKELLAPVSIRAVSSTPFTRIGTRAFSSDLGFRDWSLPMVEYDKNCGDDRRRSFLQTDLIWPGFLQNSQRSWRAGHDDRGWGSVPQYWQKWSETSFSCRTCTLGVPWATACLSLPGSEITAQQTVFPDLRGLSTISDRGSTQVGAMKQLMAEFVIPLRDCW